MSRAVLVMDMPESCAKCMFLYEFGGIKNCNLMNVMYGGASRLSQTNFAKCRHEKCPLRPTPEWMKELKALRTWKNDVMEDFCKVDCSSVGEVYQCGGRRGYNKAIDDFVDKADDLLGASDDDIYCKESIREIAEQLKAGDCD